MAQVILAQGEGSALSPHSVGPRSATTTRIRNRCSVPSNTAPAIPTSLLQMWQQHASGCRALCAGTTRSTAIVAFALSPPRNATPGSMVSCWYSVLASMKRPKRLCPTAGVAVLCATGRKCGSTQISRSNRTRSSGSKRLKETLINSRFAQFNTHGILNFKMRHESSRFSSIPRVRGPICAICGGHCPFQDAPWACSAISCFLAITRLARPNRLNIWEPFLASPL